MYSNDTFESELVSLLKDYIVHYIHIKPENILLFSFEYFNSLYKKYCMDESLNYFGRKSHTDSAMSTSRITVTSSYSRKRVVSSEKLPIEHPVSPNNFVPEFDKTPETIEKIREAIKAVFLFKALNDDDLNLVVSNMFERKTNPGEIIIQIGEEGDYFYVVGQGIFEVYIMSDKEPICVKSLHGEGYFGEVSIMYDCLRTATVISRTNGIVYGLGKKTFKEVICIKAFEKRRKCYEILRTIDIFTSLGEYEINHMADSLIRRLYRSHENIMVQDETAEEMYIIESGEVLITRRDEDVERNLFYLHPGDYFGELSFVNNQTRHVSAHAVTDVEVMVITKEGFERLLGPCMNILRKNIDRNKYM